MRKITLLLAIALSALFGNIVARDSATIDGIEYEIISYSGVSVIGINKQTETVTIPNSITYDGIEYNVICIDNSEYDVFYRCPTLKTLVLPASLKNIWGRLSTKTLENFIVHEDNPQYSSADGVLYNKDMKTLYNFPAGRTNCVIPDGVTAIEVDAFYGCDKLKSITLPASLSDIRGSLGGISLSSITVDPANKYYCSDDGVLFSKDKTKLILYPEAREDGCYKVPNGVSEVSRDCFAYCQNLTSLNLNRATSLMGQIVSAPNLQSIYVSASNPMFSSVEGVLLSKDGSSILCFPQGRTGAYTIPETVDHIRYGQFNGCSKLTALTIPTSVRSVGDDPFVGCTSLANIYCYTETVPESDDVDEQIFDSEIAHNINFYANNPELYKQAYYWCDFHTYDTLDNIPAPNEILYTFDEVNKTASVVPNPKNYAGDVVIPQTVEKNGVTYRVKSIGDKAFYWCKALTSVTIPFGVESIGTSAFAECIQLQHVELPSSVKKIGQYAFGDCIGMKSLTIWPTYEFLGIESRAFEHCIGLKNIYCYGIDKLPTAATDIFNLVDVSQCHLFVDESMLSRFKADAFWNRFQSISSTIVKVNGLSYELLGNYTACPTSNNTYTSKVVRLPKTISIFGVEYKITTLGLNALNNNNCATVEEIYLPTTLVEIPACSFGSAHNLKSIHIGEAVKAISEYAFQNCSSLKHIYTLAKEPQQLDASVFNNASTEIVVHVPSGCKATYEAADFWRNLTIVENALVYELPDMNMDKNLDMRDVKLIVGVAVDGAISAEEAKAADMNFDNKISVTDITHAVQLMNSFKE